MRIIDKRGQILGAVNVIDLVIVIMIAVAVVIAYRFFTGVRTPDAWYRPQGESVWVTLTLALPVETAALADDMPPGVTGRDPRSGQPVVEVLGGRAGRVDLRLRALRAMDGQALFRGQRLLPGQPLHVETETHALDGWIIRVDATPGAHDG